MLNQGTHGLVSVEIKFPKRTGLNIYFRERRKKPTFSPALLQFDIRREREKRFTLGFPCYSHFPTIQSVQAVLVRFSQVSFSLKSPTPQDR